MGLDPLTLGSRTIADISEQPDVLGQVVARNASALDRASSIIANKRVVRLIGIGSSKHAAGYGARAIDVIAGTPAVVLPAPSVAVTLPRLDPTQPFVVLSQSGRTPAIIDAVRRIRDARVDVIAIVNEPDSPLEEIATVTLRCDAGIERVVPATKSVTAQMLLLRAVASTIEEDETAALTAAARSAIVLDVNHVVGGDGPSAVVCGGFAGPWIADEIALKFTEMAGVLVTSEDVVEHFHGPRAAEASTIAFLDPDDPNSNELSRHRNVRTIGPQPGMDLVTPSTGSASLDAIVTVIVGQRIAHAWAIELGEDPDADRGLSKVTRTR
ncbi:MAG: SIS domain-containing protein [Actinobacteria bacterium]|nr:SIS domain-containing protein [Actinomycetota bacterium]